MSPTSNDPSHDPTACEFSRQSRQWTRHFARNQNHMEHVPWASDQPISAEHKAAIADSIAVFQLGENSEGNSFLRAGREYAERTGDHEYLTALDLFIKEEQSHSAALGRFMDQQNISRIQKEWTDTTFRFLRKIAGLNVCITILITAEIIAAVYYRALGQATDSPVLRAICGQILIDEAHHLKFQASTLAKERVAWHPFKRWCFYQLHRLVLLGTILVVWKEHRRVYRAGNFSFFQWVAMTWATLEEVLLTLQTGLTQDESGAYRLPAPQDTSTTQIPGLPSMTFGKRPISTKPDPNYRPMQEIVAMFE